MKWDVNIDVDVDANADIDVDDDFDGMKQFDSYCGAWQWR